MAVKLVNNFARSDNLVFTLLLYGGYSHLLLHFDLPTPSTSESAATICKTPQGIPKHFSRRQRNDGVRKRSILETFNIYSALIDSHVLVKRREKYMWKELYFSLNMKGEACTLLLQFSICPSNFRRTLVKLLELDTYLANNRAQSLTECFGCYVTYQSSQWWHRRNPTWFSRTNFTHSTKR